MRSLSLMLGTLALLSFPACGGKDEPAAPRTEAAAASVTPFPSIDMADLAAETTYTMQQFKPNITLTLPEGEWKAVGADSPDHVEIEPTSKDPVDSSALAFHHMTQVFASFGRFYVLEQPDGKELVVEQYVEPASAFKAQRPAFEAVIESATTAGG